MKHLKCHKDCIVLLASYESQKFQKLSCQMADTCLLLSREE